MTFLCTIDGALAPGHDRRLTPGASWPRPWGFRCDSCSRVFPYGCVVTRDHVKLTPPTVRHVRGDVHRCAFCEGYVEPAEQLAIEVEA